MYAAETGLQTALSQIRSAAGTPDAAGTTYGSPAKLPCSLTGTVGSSTTVAYRVSVQYFTDTDPTSKSAEWRTDHQLACSATTGLAVSPAYALLTSHGTSADVSGLASGSGNRTLTSLYSFKMSNANVSGGLMLTFSGAYCVQADSATEGSAVHYAAVARCVHSAPLQTWEWDTDYRIRLTSSVTTPGGGLCLTGGSSGNVAVTLTSCRADSVPQLFSYEGGAKFRGQNADNTGYGNCLWAGTTSSGLSGAQLTSGSSGCSSSNNDWGSWSPEPQFGAGAAGLSTHQLVNYAQFGRCFDVTGANITADFEIIYPCKQDPTGHNGFLWNHQYSWTEPASGSSAKQVVTTNPGSGAYCLTTPARGVSPAYPKFTTCVAGAVTQQWVRSSAVTGDYANSYTFKDTNGYCLSVGPQWSGQPWSTVVVATCTGGPEQKWDAPPNAVAASVTNAREEAGGGS